MSKRGIFERSRRELSLDVSIGVHIFLVVKQSSLENQSRGCAKTPILTVLVCMRPDSNTQLPTVTTVCIFILFYFLRCRFF